MYNNNARREPITIDEAHNALQFISPSVDRDTWFSVAAALKDEYGDQAYELFDGWSQGGHGYKKQACKDTWRSASAGHFHIGTVIKMAIDGGWQRDRRELTPEEKRDYAKKMAAQEAARAKHIEADAIRDATMRAAVAAACVQAWEENTTRVGVTEHPYIVKKQVSGTGCKLVNQTAVIRIDDQAQTATLVLKDEPTFSKACRRDKKTEPHISIFWLKEGNLLVPLYREVGQVVSLQRISSDCTKMFPKYATKKGSFMLLGEPTDSQPLAHAEGYATGCTVHDLVEWPVAVCFDSGNMAAVADKLQALPRSQSVWLCDHDEPNLKTGVQAGAKATAMCQKKHQGVVLTPNFAGAASNAARNAEVACA